ncbi:MAG: phosphoribosylamine--glycine ligase [Alphaproteobacteria bacterium]|nr:phosphoribosylamine--glycine ligase [Alphaproteobacteria bacterium]
MRILVVGSGGREHALCWAIAASPLCDALFCAPGNAGIAGVARCVAVDVMDLDGIVALARDERIDLVVVGPEAPLVAGLVDRLEAAGIKAFGPTAAAAALEGSKAFMKDLCARHGIPTASYRRFTDAAAARAWVREKGAPIVVKADGLAAGKGVTVARSVDEALAAVDAAMVDGVFGTAGAELVIEDLLEGEEASFFALVDGRHVLPLAAAQDHKTVGDGDTGPNTGGMGAYSPTPAVDDAMAERVMAEIVRPTVAAMAAEGRPVKGVLFFGLMIGPAGPKLIEINVRFGDPECQVLMARLMSDLLPALVAAADGVLDDFDLRWYPHAALCVVMATRGYPGAYPKATEIRGLERAAAVPDVEVFHAATRREGDRILSNGGRVLAITATGTTVAEAQRKAYAAVDAIDWPEGFCRRDIGWRAVEKR